MDLFVEDPRGFKHLWLKSVVGFNPTCHCFHCLVGRREPRVFPRMAPGTTVPLDPSEAKFFYLCGVAYPWSWDNNLHLAVRVEPGSSTTAFAYNGCEFTVRGGVAVPIPALPDGFEGRPKSFTTCRNFQFGVAYAAELVGRQGELF